MKRETSAAVERAIESVATNDQERAILKRFLTGITWQSPRMVRKLSIAAAQVAEEFQRLKSGGVLIITIADGGKSWANPAVAVKCCLSGTHRLATVEETEATREAESLQSSSPAHS